MSGPIVRKYGFPNFEKIFGEREPQHGVDDPQSQTPASPPEDVPARDAKSETKMPKKPGKK